MTTCSGSEISEQLDSRFTGMTGLKSGNRHTFSDRKKCDDFMRKTDTY